jgi:hypothetical protein
VHSFAVLCFVLALEKSLELFLNKRNTPGAPLLDFILRGFTCPTCGNSSVSQFCLSTNERREGIEQRPQRKQAIDSVSLQYSGTVKNTNLISGWSWQKNGINGDNWITLGKCYLVRVSAQCI